MLAQYVRTRSSKECITCVIRVVAVVCRRQTGVGPAAPGSAFPRLAALHSDKKNICQVWCKGSAVGLVRVGTEHPKKQTVLTIHRKMQYSMVVTA